MTSREEILMIEYQETVNTLRNWDTLFVNLLISTIVVGGIGSGLAFVKDNSNNVNLKDALNDLVLIMSIIVCCIICGYVYYALTVAKHKMKVIQDIENELKMQGAYQNSGLQKGYIKIIFAGVMIFIIGWINAIIQFYEAISLDTYKILCIALVLALLILNIFSILDYKKKSKKK